MHNVQIVSGVAANFPATQLTQDPAEIPEHPVMI
jgi:hypothetical protein